MYAVILMHETEQIYAKLEEDLTSNDENIGNVMIRSNNTADIISTIERLREIYPKYHTSPLPKELYT